MVLLVMSKNLSHYLSQGLNFFPSFKYNYGDYHHCPKAILFNEPYSGTSHESNQRDVASV